MKTKENNKTKPFYNSSIPSDWEEKELDSLGKVSSGGTPDTTNEKFWNGNINWCTPTDITKLNGSKYIGETVLKISDDGLKNSSATLLPKGSVIVCTRATIGKAAISTEQISTNQGFKNIIPDNKKVDVEFLYYSIINSEHQLLRLGNGSTFLEVPKSDFEHFKIPLPPLPEQKAIAHILSLMDVAINKNNLLIARKVWQKKWLMQNLLAGKKRLNGFKKEKWKEIHIGDVSKEVSIKNSDDKQLTVLSCTKHDGLVPSLEYFGRKIFADDVSTYKVVPKNHFAYATNHIEEGSIGYQKIFDEALISPMYTVFKTDSSINDSFFYKLLKSYPLVYQYQNRMEGSIDRRGGLRWDAFSIIKIRIPSREEQTAIAKVLQAADKEIQLLKTKTEKLREKKKGLMQVLLTGKKRLKIN